MKAYKLTPIDTKGQELQAVTLPVSSALDLMDLLWHCDNIDAIDVEVQEDGEFIKDICYVRLEGKAYWRSTADLEPSTWLIAVTVDGRQEDLTRTAISRTEAWELTRRKLEYDYPVSDIQLISVTSKAELDAEK